MAIEVPDPPPWADELTSVGVTGTNGKTSTTLWLAAMLATLGRPVAVATTLGYALDDEPFAAEKDFGGFLATMRAALARGGAYAALEMTSEALAMGFARAWPARVGVFTNLSFDHLDAHGTPEHYLASKAQLFMHLRPGGTAVLNAADGCGALLEEVLPGGIEVVRYGLASRGETTRAEVVGRDVTFDWAGTQVLLDDRPALRVRAIGEVFAENAIAAWLGAVAAGADPQTAATALAEAPAPPGRFDVVNPMPEAGAPRVVVDYAHTPDALTRTLATAKTLARRDDGAVRVVFGAGGGRDPSKRPVMGEAAADADAVWITTDNPRDEDPAVIAEAVAEGLPGHANCRILLARDAAIREAIAASRGGDVVLVAGKGHERDMVIGGQKVTFSDGEVARAALRGDPLS